MSTEIDASSRSAAGRCCSAKPAARFSLRRSRSSSPSSSSCSPRRPRSRLSARCSRAPISKTRTIGLWIDDVAKLTLTGLAFSLVFQARQFSMGVQGQVYMGGLAAAFVALSARSARPGSACRSASPPRMVAGGFYGFLPGIAKARLGANEIVSSLMLNYIAIDVINYPRAHPDRRARHGSTPSPSRKARSFRR